MDLLLGSKVKALRDNYLLTEWQPTIQQSNIHSSGANYAGPWTASKQQGEQADTVFIVNCLSVSVTSKHPDSTFPYPELAQYQTCSHFAGREQTKWLRECISFSKWEIDSNYIANLLSVPDENSSHTNKCNILIVMFHTDVYRENEEELKAWAWFLPQRHVRYFSADFILTNTREIRVQKTLCMTLSSKVYSRVLAWEP